jgi:hypothetical protein
MGTRAREFHKENVTRLTVRRWRGGNRAAWCFQAVELYKKTGGGDQREPATMGRVTLFVVTALAATTLYPMTSAASRSAVIRSVAPSPAPIAGSPWKRSAGNGWLLPHGRNFLTCGQSNPLLKGTYFQEAALSNLRTSHCDSHLPSAAFRISRRGCLSLAGAGFFTIPELLRREHRNRVADSFGRRADNLDPVVATEWPSNRALSEVGSPVHKTYGGTSEADRHAHHGRCIVAGAIANIRRCCD